MCAVNLFKTHPWYVKTTHLPENNNPTVLEEGPDCRLPFKLPTDLHLPIANCRLPSIIAF